MKLIERIKLWYEGEWIPFDPPVERSIFFAGGDFKRSPSARFVRVIIESFSKKKSADPWWRRPVGIFFLTVAAALFVALCKMRWPELLK